MTRIDCAVGAALLAMAGGALAQAPAGPPRPSGSNWPNQQRQQAWAGEKIARSPRRHEWVEIRFGGRTIRAWVTYPQTTAKVPVVLVMHEVFGLTDSTRNTADEVAAMGYITIAPDMVSGWGPGGGGVESFVTTNAGSLMTAMPNETVNAAFDGIANYALKLPGANGKLAIVGLSWGGGAAFRYVATPGHNPALRTVCIFYDVGPPASTQGPGGNTAGTGPASFPVAAIDVPVHGFYGSLDTRVMNSLDATKAAMAAAGKSYDPVVYEGADHAYMRVGEDPNDKNAANKPAVSASLARLRDILGKL